VEFQQKNKEIKLSEIPSQIIAALQVEVVTLVLKLCQKWNQNHPFPEIENNSSFKFQHFGRTQNCSAILIDFIQAKASNQQEIRLNLICTHNSEEAFYPSLGTNCSTFNIKMYLLFWWDRSSSFISMAAKTLKKVWFKIIIAAGTILFMP
jgi:hypothetical protein